MVSLRNPQVFNNENLPIAEIPPTQSKTLPPVTSAPPLLKPNAPPKAGNLPGEKSGAQPISKPPTTKGPVAKTLGAAAIPKHKPKDIEMVAGDNSDGSYDSLPELYYPDTDNEPMGPAGQSDGVAKDKQRPKPIPHPETPMVSRWSELTVPPPYPRSPCTNYVVWAEQMKEVKKILENGAKWSNAGICKIFARLGMLPWWFAISVEEAKGKGIDWVLWKEKMLKEWKE